MPEVVPVVRSTRPLSPVDVVRAARPADAARAFADITSALEARVEEAPDDYAALIALGELKLWAGLDRGALHLLQAATMLPPPSWEAYQRTSALLRRAESSVERSFVRIHGAGLPGAAALARGLRRLLSRPWRRGSA